MFYFYDTLNLFYLWLYVIGYLIKDHSQASTSYTVCGALAGTRNSSVGPPRIIDMATHCTMSEHSYHIRLYMTMMTGIQELLVIVILSGVCKKLAYPALRFTIKTVNLH